jgi:hypothetical protein
LGCGIKIIILSFHFSINNQLIPTNSGHIKRFICKLAINSVQALRQQPFRPLLTRRKFFLTLSSLYTILYPILYQKGLSRARKVFSELQLAQIATQSATLLSPNNKCIVLVGAFVTAPADGLAKHLQVWLHKTIDTTTTIVCMILDMINNHIIIVILLY